MVPEKPTLCGANPTQTASAFPPLPGPCSSSRVRESSNASIEGTSIRPAPLTLNSKPVNFSVNPVCPKPKPSRYHHPYNRLGMPIQEMPGGPRGPRQNDNGPPGTDVVNPQDRAPCDVFLNVSVGCVPGRGGLTRMTCGTAFNAFPFLKSSCTYRFVLKPDFLIFANPRKDGEPHRGLLLLFFWPSWRDLVYPRIFVPLFVRADSALSATSAASGTSLADS